MIFRSFLRNNIHICDMATVCESQNRIVVFDLIFGFRLYILVNLCVNAINCIQKLNLIQVEKLSICLSLFSFVHVANKIFVLLRTVARLVICFSKWKKTGELGMNINYFRFLYLLLSLPIWIFIMAISYCLTDGHQCSLNLEFYCWRPPCIFSSRPHVAFRSSMGTMWN